MPEIVSYPDPMGSFGRRVIGWGLLASVGLLACSPVGDDLSTATSAVSDIPPTTESTTSTLGPESTSTSVHGPDTVVVEPPGPLLVMGDWGSGTLPQGAVAGAMERYARGLSVEAVLTTGDNFYSDDSDFLMRPYGWVEERDIPWWITWGNHDVESAARIEVVNGAFDDPARWIVHEWGRVDVVILDSNQVSSLQQAAFFLQAMATSDRPMIIALHHPPYSCSHHGSTIDVVNDMVDLLDDDVLLVLAGHDHNYQRFENADVTYIVTGGGGRALYELNECSANHPKMLAGAELHHFVILEQTDSSIELVAVDVNGEPIDHVSLPLHR